MPICDKTNHLLSGNEHEKLDRHLRRSCLNWRGVPRSVSYASTIDRNVAAASRDWKNSPLFLALLF